MFQADGYIFQSILFVMHLQPHHQNSFSIRIISVAMPFFRAHRLEPLDSDDYFVALILIGRESRLFHAFISLVVILTQYAMILTQVPSSSSSSSSAFCDPFIFFARPSDDASDYDDEDDNTKWYENELRPRHPNEREADWSTRQTSKGDQGRDGSCWRSSSPLHHTLIMIAISSPSSILAQRIQPGWCTREMVTISCSSFSSLFIACSYVKKVSFDHNVWIMIQPSWGEEKTNKA